MCRYPRAGLRELLCLLSAAFASISGLAQSQSERSFTVRDSIEMTNFVSPSGLGKSVPVETSPDGKYFWFVTSRGIIASDQIESTLWLIPSHLVRAFLDDRLSVPVAPRAVARVREVPISQAHSSYLSLITEVRWSENSQAIYFLGQDSRGGKTLFEVDVRANRCQRISPLDQNVQGYDFKNVHLAFTATPSILPKSQAPWSSDQAINRNAGAVTGMGLEDILKFPPETHGLGSIDRVPGLWAGTIGRIQRVPAGPGNQPDVQHSREVVSISPDGRMVIRLLPISYIRPEWSLYNPMSGFESWRIRPEDNSQIAPHYWYRLREYMLFDRKTGKETTLVDAPSGDSLAVQDRSLAVWSPDNKHVLLGNVALPLEGTDTAEQERRKTTCAVADVEIATLKVQCVVFSRDQVNVTLTAANPHPLRLRGVSSDQSSDAITARFSWHDQWAEAEHYQRVDGRWILEGVTKGEGSETVPLALNRAQVELRVQQDLNTPPALWARDTQTDESKQLWDPNPDLGKMRLGQASLYHWTDGTGFTSTGILVLPPDYRSGTRYPLVIQTHGVLENIFITDGSYPTAMAARPLAAAGIVVLQTQWNATHFAEREEFSDQVAMFDAAIAQLSKDGIIDVRRVGIVGFSRTCGHVEQALIANPERYAAATIADGLDVGYMQYMLFADGRPSLAREYERIVGVPPVGSGLRKWVDFSPSFHLENVRTPLRIETIDSSSILTMWETYSALRRLGRPVDLIYMQGAQHILQRPLDKLASEQGNVDWFRFWLQGYVDPDPAKSAQYARWKGWRTPL